MLRRWIFGALMVLGSTCVAAADPLYTVRDLGWLLGTPNSMATAINDAGVVVGVSIAAGGTESLFRYDGALHDLGTFPGSRGIFAAGLSSEGQIAGSAYPGSNPPGPRPFLYDGSYHDLGTLNAQSGQAASINDSGRIVGTLTFPDASQHAFYYDGTMHDLSSALGGSQSTATCINNAGQIVGSLSPHQPGVAQSYLYDRTVHLLGEFTPGYGSTAAAIGPSGQVVGSATVVIPQSGAHTRAFIWDGAMRQLPIPAGALSQAGTDSFATAINGSGQIVGYAEEREIGPFAVLWDAGTGQGHYLDDLIDPALNLQVEVATGINAAGQIIGYGGQPVPPLNRVPFEHALLLTPRIPGDANLDGVVNFSDLLILAQNYGLQTTHFTQGDFDGDGAVGFSDLLLLAQHYGQGEAGAATSAAVPEPNGLVGLLIAAGLLREAYLYARANLTSTPSIAES